MHKLISGLLAVVLGIALVRADGINIPAPSWTYAITSLGTGVATALGINVGSTGAVVTNGGALGTPSSGVGTNLTGTAASLTAGNVTTNANLTGDVTSVGNATTLSASARLKSNTIAATRDLTAATGSVSYTGMGFTPTACLAAGQVTQSITQYTTIFAFADSTRAANNMNLQGSVTSFGAGSFLTFADVTQVNLQNSTITSFDADGLTLSWAKTGSPTGTASFRIICFR